MAVADLAVWQSEVKRWKANSGNSGLTTNAHGKSGNCLPTLTHTHKWHLHIPWHSGNSIQLNNSNLMRFISATWRHCCCRHQHLNLNKWACSAPLLQQLCHVGLAYNCQTTKITTRSYTNFKHTHTHIYTQVQLTSYVRCGRASNV